MTRTSSHRSRAAFALALALAGPAAAGPRDPLYQWSDAAGAIHYTTEIARIPEDRRSAAIVISASRDAARAAEPATERAPAPAPQQTQTPAPAAAPPPAEAAPPPASVHTDEKLTALDARIAELERSIAADEAALGDYISDPERAKRQRESGEVAAIADRLPRLQDQLRELRVQRDAAARAAPTRMPPDSARVVALAGGVGAARFLGGLVRAVPADDVAVIVNTGDDMRFYGVHVSPDVDIVTYTLAVGSITRAATASRATPPR